MVSFLLSLRAKFWAIGAAVLTVAAAVLRMQVLKNQRDKARIQKEVLETSVAVEKTKKRIEKRKKEEVDVDIHEIKEEMKKEGEDFEGIDGLTHGSRWSDD